MSTLKVTNIQNPSTSSGGVSIDTSGHVTVNGVAMPSAGPLSNRNKIINGDMRIDQRNAGGSVADMRGLYTLDRWIGRGQSGGGVQSCVQSSTAPSRFTKSALITTTTSATPSAADPYRYEQFIEGFNCADFAWGTANAQPVTVSFWVRSSLTGTFGFSVSNSAATRSYVGQYTINSANTFEYKTVTIIGDTSGTWLTDNGIGIRLAFDTGSGSDSEATAGAWTAAFAVRSSGNVRLISTNGATFYITGVQLEVGSVATPFEHRSYGDELARCQRYYYRVNATSIYTTYGHGWNNSTSGGQAVLRHPVRMRVPPTSLDYAFLSSTVLGVSEALIASAALNGDTNGTDTTTISITSSGLFTAGFMSLTSKATVNSYIGFSAEL